MLQTTSAESFLMLFVHTKISQGNVFYVIAEAMQYFAQLIAQWNHINWLICDNISDIFSIDQIHKAKKFCWRPHELSHFSYYLFKPEVIKAMNVFCLIGRRIE